MAGRLKHEAINIKVINSCFACPKISESILRGHFNACSICLTDRHAKTALELVLVMVEEGAENQGERQGQQLLF